MAESGYISDSAASFYQQLEGLLDSGWEIRKKYDALRDVFKRAINQKVGLTNLNFSGTFAKLDYLIKEKGISEAESVRLHGTRRTLNTLSEISDRQLQDSIGSDVKSAAMLVEALLGEPIPKSLRRKLPVDDKPRTWGKFDSGNLRCVVDTWDNEYIHVTEERGGLPLTVCYGQQNVYLTREGRGDWSYLSLLLRRGVQLNLVRVRYDGEICMPELIIYEPDYLVNVTTIASCFETYAESPLVALVNKFKPQPNTLPIHLGNLSGQYLDETVHRSTRSFEEGMMDFFRNNAVGLVACDAMRSREDVAKFYADARMQKSNVEKLIGNDLPKAVGGIDMRKAVLEPTFFSEVLGIQGRLDLLVEKDGEAVIVEQKSGKGAFVPTASPHYNPNRPKPQEKHLVQLMLYRALFVYEFDKYAGQLRHVMLLYSRYPEGLVSTAQRPELMLRAIRMRNLLAYSEILYASDGVGMLDGLTPEQLNEKNSTGVLWTRYTRPELNEVLSPIQNASPLERAYFFRFMQFLEKEHLLSKIGNKIKDNSGFASIWLDSLEDKIASGGIYCNLTLDTAAFADSPVTDVTLRFAETDAADTSNFRVGDIVVLYPYKENTEPNACAWMVERGTIADISVDGVRVALRNPQTDSRVFPQTDGIRWAIEHDLFDSSTNALYAGMHSFLTAPIRRRDMLLSQRMPEIDAGRCRKGDYGDFNTLVERAKQARELFLVIGPPGTGKTSFGLLNILREELLEADTSILLLSYTNRAVDEICSKLKEQGIDFIRIGSEISCDKAYHANLLRNKIQQCRTGDAVAETLKDARVVCATTAALNSNVNLFKIKRFDLAIVDEASQILEPHLLGLMCARSGNADAISRFVLIGDHKQLPAVVQQTEAESRVTEPELLSIGLTDCRRSLFERLLSSFKTVDGYDCRYVYMLTRQGRMHRDIADFPNEAFYGGRLDVVPLPHQLAANTACTSTDGICRLLQLRRVAFVASEKPEMSVSAKTNQVEADMIAAMVERIFRQADHFDDSATVGVIVPYRNQIATVRNAIDRYGIPALHSITIDTVERFQGSQRDYIIYGLTVQQRCQLNFLTDNVFEEDGTLIDRKLNVAMTRARKHLTIVGNPDILAGSAVYRRLMDFMKSRGCYFNVACEKFCAGDFSV